VILTALFVPLRAATMPPVFLDVELVEAHSFSDAVDVVRIRLEEKNGLTTAIRLDLAVQNELTENYRFYLHLTSKSDNSKFNRDFAPYLPPRLWEAGTNQSVRRLLDLPKGDYYASLGMFNGNGRLGQPLKFGFRVK
jgi:hypothetical protein